MQIIPDKKAIVAHGKVLIQAGLKPSDFSKTARVPNSPKVVIPYDVLSVAKLYEHDIDVRGPITYDYPFKWHKHLPPFAHQIVTADFVTKMQSGFIFNDIGTAKTLSVLWAADYLQSLGLVRRVLVVCTLSTTWLVWANTLFKSFPNRTFTLLHGTKAKRVRELEKEYDYYIINHDGLKVMGEWLKRNDKSTLVSTLFDDRPDIDMIIVDESAVFRNARTDLYRSLKWVADKVQSRRVWLMTGNPTPNNPTDIWAQARLVDETLFHKSFVRFRHTVMHKVTEFKWVPNPGRS
jgi:SNF2 family DNA or RNA helicase